MSAIKIQLYNWVGYNRAKMATLIGAISLISTSFSEYIYTGNLVTNFTLGLGNGICAFILVFAMHYLLFSKLKFAWQKYLIIALLPLVFMLMLITSFAAISTMVSYSAFDVTFTHQLFLLGYFILGQGYFYLIFSPKIPFAFTCLLAMWLFVGGIKSAR
ncbi:MAG: hypothetical protein HRU29_05260 [Rhizobiales bacterium]|nr:hypothetical protein [Hyphomicrobiales bacterium]NRB13791.1 hypothetical protein [Hyphomicrobiales bacterium]